MLRQIKLHNFKCYLDETVPFGGLTVFSGANGAGKSTIIQAVLLMRQQLLLGRTRTSDSVALTGGLVNLGTALDVIPSFLTGRDDQTVILKAAFDSGSADFEFARAAGEADERGLEVSVCSKSTLELESEAFVYLSSERIGPRLSYSFPELGSSSNRYGKGGEYAIYYLNRFGEKKIPNGALCDLIKAEDDPTLSGCLSACLDPIHCGTRVLTNCFADARQVSLSYSFNNGQTWSRDYRAVNVGFGLTNVLPIYIALLRAQPGELVIIENPEAHLHPRGQTAVGRFFAQVAATGVQVVIETHSDHVLNGIRLAVKERQIAHDKVMLHFVTNEDTTVGAKIVTPRIMPSGRIDVWPAGFFDEYENVQMKLF